MGSHVWKGVRGVSSDPLFLLALGGRVLLAIALGAAIGFERQWRLRTAGIRTNALVAAGSALFVMLGVVGADGRATVDPTRVAAQVVSGIGFLGAGVILRDGLKVRGLTTAATLWCASAVGSLAGAGMELLAVVGGAAILGTNILLRPLSRLVNRHAGAPHSEADPTASDSTTSYVFEVVTAEKSEQRVRALVLQAVSRPEFTLHSIDVRAAKDSHMRVLAGLSVPSAQNHHGLEAAVHRISLDPKVVSTRWWMTETDA